MLHDLVVVGAGPVGSALALALARADLDVVVVDARHRGETMRGDRSLALSHGARLILDRLGVWSEIVRAPDAATPITSIDVSQAGGFGRVRLEAEEQGIPALGYVVGYRALQGALDASLARTGVVVRYGERVTNVDATQAYAAIGLAGDDAQPLLTRLAVVADGDGAAVAGLDRQKHDYGQVALIASVWRDTPHGGLAYERFTPEGPVALLPEGDHYGLIWTVTPDRARLLLALTDADFINELASRFGPRAGRFTRVDRRRAFPLALEFARHPAALRCVAVGNAAQMLHPVSGQGFNLGLRDAWELAEVIRDTPRDRLGDRAMVARYLHGRRTDRIAGMAFTHGLVAVFGNDLPFVRWPRGLALAVLDALPPAKRLFTRAMLFGLR